MPKFLSLSLSVVMLVSTLLALPIIVYAGDNSTEIHDFYTEIITAPDCRNSGMSLIRCKNCDYEEWITLYPTDHSYVEKIMEESTCTEVGVIEYSCVNCGYSYSDTVALKAHDYRLIQRVEQTCAKSGMSVYSCKFCEDTYTEYVPALGHLITVDKAIEPTCTQTGWTEGSHCERCGEIVITREMIPATGHDFGSNEKDCPVCGAENPNHAVPSTETLGTGTDIPNSGADVSNADIVISYIENDSNNTGSLVPDTLSGSSVSQQSITITDAKPAGAKKVSGVWVNTKYRKPTVKKLTKGKKSFKVTWKKVSGVKGYQIQYSTSKKFTKKKTKSVMISKNTAKHPSKTIKKLKSNKKYYVRVRTYKTVKVNGKSVKVYSKWSKVKSVITK